MNSALLKLPSPLLALVIVVGWLLIVLPLFAFLSSFVNTLHWAIVVFIIFAVMPVLFYMDFWAMTKGPGKTLPVPLGISRFAALLLCVIIEASLVSFQMFRFGWADYGTVPYNDYAYYYYIEYYTWIVLDMIPGLHAVELLHFDSPLKPKEAAGGIPVVLFRAFILFVLLRALKMWLQTRRQVSDSTSDT
jgi:hypothetical protein